VAPALKLVMQNEGQDNNPSRAYIQYCEDALAVNYDLQQHSVQPKGLTLERSVK
ncbi:hypothetical protein FIBSPDRAFT_880700, partial [Athelia psychrophila]